MSALRLPTLLIILTSAALMAGCTTTQSLKISTVAVDKPVLTLPKTDQLSLRDIKWIVVNKTNVNQILKDLEDNKENVVLFALTDKGYQNILLNQNDLKQLIIQQQAIIGAYEKYYVETQKILKNGK